jgi:hypothetical protein
MEDKAVSLFPRLYNIQDFINRDHPQFHPDTQQYINYWKEHEQKCVEGMWGYDSDGENGGWRYMPSFLYYYINLCQIIIEKDLGTAKTYPMLRDVEWMLAYGWLIARSFSGFEEDTEYTCHRLVGKIEELGEESLTPKELKNLEKYRDSLLTPEGELKKYANAKDYLYGTHKKPLGKPLFENPALNFFVLGSRGFGKSFFCANAVIGHEFNFYGKRSYDSSYLNKPSGVEIFVGSAIAAKSQDLLSKFLISQEHIKTSPGAFGAEEDFRPGYFYNNTSGTLDPAAKKPYKHSFEIKINGTWTTKGTGTVIKHGVYTTENPQAAVGTRPSVMVIEEVGLLGNLLTVHGANETCQIRDNKFGSSFYIGTGGNMDKIVESKIVFEDPEAYNFVPYSDLWEGRKKPIGFFLPSYYVDNDFKDENGNTDIEKAFAQEIYEREIRAKAKTSNALTEYVMSRPIKPSEMFLSAKNRFFPVALLKQRLQQIAQDPPHFTTGTLEYTESKEHVKWIPDVSLRPIEELNLKSDQDTSGAIKIYEHPPDIHQRFKMKRPLYKIAYDPVKDDNGGTSLASVLVYKGIPDQTWVEEREACQNEIVAEYIGRLDRVENIHEIVVKLALYYGCRVMVENNLPDFIRYCRLRKRTYVLQPSPYLAISKAVANPTRKYDVGVTMTTALKFSHTEQLISDWLLEEVELKGEITEVVNRLKSVRLIRELINYHRDDNFDHVSALKLLVLWIKNEEEYHVKKDNAGEHYMNVWNTSFDLLKTKNMKNPYYVY